MIGARTACSTFKRVALAVRALDPYHAQGARVVLPIRSKTVPLVSRAEHDVLMLAVARARAAFESTVEEYTT